MHPFCTTTLSLPENPRTRDISTLAQGTYSVNKNIALGILLKSTCIAFRNIIDMRLRDLQDRLRAHIRARIGRRELTGSGLSHQAGFQQGHLSNFLNSRRGLSLESMDRLLETLQIDVLDLVDAGEIQ